MVSLAVRTLNRWLGDESWARERLAAHAGCSFAIDVGPSSHRFTIAAGGTLADDPAAAGRPDVRLALPVLAVPSFLADPGRWGEFVTADGDSALATTLRELATILPWLVEADFAHALGPIAGRRVADAGRVALAWPGHVAERLLANAGNYARDESQLLAHPTEQREFTGQVGELSARAAAIESRIDRLEETRRHGDERA